ncbi:hypothetical protein TRFO_13545 [Tritrichomonas foetus]|uniref:Uncharacterized protein n=1 Tax=Tritrichomonas foetus TaxID=1144522 RepID=A0A1J4KYU4_9EUKA|nr:hypothetical protein TRFO_13545 [Tritrichomonas foetus]|eukprot:OHT16048.1 hypothetical protein TRFO_13545 [Tritrichomonas foetus]
MHINYKINENHESCLKKGGTSISNFDMDQTNIKKCQNQNEFILLINEIDPEVLYHCLFTNKSIFCEIINNYFGGYCTTEPYHFVTYLDFLICDLENILNSNDNETMIVIINLLVHSSHHFDISNNYNIENILSIMLDMFENCSFMTKKLILYLSKTLSILFDFDMTQHEIFEKMLEFMADISAEKTDQDYIQYILNGNEIKFISSSEASPIRDPQLLPPVTFDSK